MTVLDERAHGRNGGQSLEEKSAEALSRCVEPRRIVKTANEWEQFVESDAHGARTSTVAPDGDGLPGAGSTVTRTPTIGRGTLGGVSVAIVTRPEASGAAVPALTGSPAVNSQT